MLEDDKARVAGFTGGAVGIRDAIARKLAGLAFAIDGGLSL
jgi:hypothetical protein